MCPVKFQGQMQGAHLTSSIPLSELGGLCLQGLLYYLYVHYVEQDPCIQWPEINISLSPISLCHSLNSRFFVSLLSQIDFSSVGAKVQLHSQIQLKVRDFSGADVFLKQGAAFPWSSVALPWFSCKSSALCSRRFYIMLHFIMAFHLCWWWTVVLLKYLIYSLNSAFCEIFID